MWTYIIELFYVFCVLELVENVKTLLYERSNLKFA